MTGKSSAWSTRSITVTRPFSSRRTSSTSAGTSTPAGGGGGFGSEKIPMTTIIAHGSRKARGIPG
jgi:hypothetical protein